ncbi:MAG: GspH/FimT family pseudopilin [Gammaproteobacteria bacterium]|nr:GspH/FimT family pseudopilin [Gammaproteobacteria bacterium]
MSMKRIHSKGFTILELMVVIAITGVVSAIGIPSMKAFLIQNELSEVAQELRLSMKLARSEAIARGVDAIVCSSITAAGPVSTCSNVAGNWNKGWLVGVDINNNGQLDEASGELIKAYDINDNTQITITPTAPAFDHTVSYLYTGWISAGTVLGFDICSGYGAADGYPRRELRSSIAGAPQLTKNTVTRC